MDHECCGCVEDKALGDEVRYYAIARSIVTVIAGVGVAVTPFAILALDYHARLNHIVYDVNQLILGGALGGVSLVMTWAWSKQRR